MPSFLEKMPKSKGFFTLFFCTATMAGNTNAQEESVVEEIVVPGRAIDTLDLNSTSSTGSRLGLTVMETPASVELIDSSVMRARGYKSVADAVKSLPGVTSGESPAAPSTFSMRGFSRSSITVLRDGIWLGPANMVMRPQNTFNLDRIEVLRGPGSALHGQGVVGGTVNSVIKRATDKILKVIETLHLKTLEDTLIILNSDNLDQALVELEPLSKYLKTVMESWLSEAQANLEVRRELNAIFNIISSARENND